VNHELVSVTDAKQYPVLNDGTQLPDTDDPANDDGVTLTLTDVPLHFTLYASSWTRTATFTTALSAHTPLLVTSTTSTFVAVFAWTVVLALALTDPIDAVMILLDPMPPLKNPPIVTCESCPASKPTAPTANPPPDVTPTWSSGNERLLT